MNKFWQLKIKYWHETTIFNYYNIIEIYIILYFLKFYRKKYILNFNKIDIKMYF